MLETCDNGNFWWSQASFCPSRPGNELGEKIFLGYSDCLIFAHPSLGISINRSCSQIIMHPRRSRSLSDTAIRPSVCPSPRRAAALGYRRAGCLQLSHVRTADPSADGRRSAASRTAISGRGGGNRLAAHGAITCLYCVPGMCALSTALSLHAVSCLPTALAGKVLQSVVSVRFTLSSLDHRAISMLPGDRTGYRFK